MKSIQIFVYLIFIFSLPVLSYSGINDLPPYTETITIKYCDNLFESIKGSKYFTTFDSNDPLVGRYSYCFSIGWPQLEHLVQAAIVRDMDRLYLMWWSSERRDTRIIASALLYSLERIDIDTFNPPHPYRFNEAERKCRIEERIFVTQNLEYFYKQFYPIFESVLGKHHLLVQNLKTMPNLNSDVLKYESKRELLLKSYDQFQ